MKMSRWANVNKYSKNLKYLKVLNLRSGNKFNYIWIKFLKNGEIIVESKSFTTLCILLELKKTPLEPNVFSINICRSVRRCHVSVIFVIFNYLRLSLTESILWRCIQCSLHSLKTWWLASMPTSWDSLWVSQTKKYDFFSVKNIINKACAYPSN